MVALICDTQCNTTENSVPVMINDPDEDNSNGLSITLST